VAGDVRERDPQREPMPECYMPYGQHGFNGPALSLVVRTAGDPNALTQTLRRMANEANPQAPMKFTTLETMLADNVAAPRFRTILFAVFGALAACLAMAGIYGVVAHTVGQRTNEIGVRMALGAGAGGVVRLVLGQGLAVAVVGLALGFAVSLASTRLLEAMLFQVQANDPWVYLAVAAMVGVMTVIAGYVPASRAARIDPVTALRQE
jgi:putative ABC transport system permease protein